MAWLLFLGSIGLDPVHHQEDQDHELACPPKNWWIIPIASAHSSDGPGHFVPNLVGLVSTIIHLRGSRNLLDQFGILSSD